ncbi:MAG: excinuclease ABC subunit UvrB [bacterium]|nr:excinuclease ABC subunit UvrB [bacterium]
MMDLKLKADFKPAGDQPQAIEKLIQGIKTGKKDQVLLGVTGSGKTVTMANVIEKLQRPALIISHNKTLAGQLYQEFRDFFPDNAVSFFVSYYDYYQPEAYIPHTDTYIEKEAEINQLIDKLRLQATTNLLTRKDTIVVASVSCIYNIGSPREYEHFTLDLKVGEKVDRKEMLLTLTKLQYERAEYGFHRGTFRATGEVVDIYPAYEDVAIRVELQGEIIKNIKKIDPLTGQTINNPPRLAPESGEAGQQLTINNILVYPTKHYMTDPVEKKSVFHEIRNDLAKRVKELKAQGKELEAHRLNQRVNYDLEMLEEVGYVNGIENYSRYFDGRAPGEPPFTLLDYFSEPYGQDWLLFVDESHMTIPQINGMYTGDKSRKETLIDYGFRLPAAIDNRPLKFDEFLRRTPQTIYTSATPALWEVSRSGDPVEQLIRPTGLVDPEIILNPTKGQIEDLIEKIEERARKGERTLVTTLTKRMAEDLSVYLKEKGLKVHYLHSEVQTLDRSDILDDLRGGKYDCLVGINLLREGLDLPEVSLVAILDADKEGFLRSETSLIQTMGRAARHVNGQVVLYADKITGSMKRAIDEISRRRKIQLTYNLKYNFTPKSIEKPIRNKLIERDKEPQDSWLVKEKKYQGILTKLTHHDYQQLLAPDKNKLVKTLTRQMKEAAQDLNFELAGQIRDKIKEIEG